MSDDVEVAPLGTFEKDGVTRGAWTQAEVVDLKFSGWRAVDGVPFGSAVPVPAKSGKGSAKKDWDAYAAASGVVAPGEAKNAGEVRALLEQAGVPTAVEADDTVGKGHADQPE